MTGFSFLPFEIQTVIFRLLSYNDLKYSTPICKDLLPAARSLLFEQICFRSNDVALLRTIGENNYEISPRIRRATFITLNPLSTSKVSVKRSQFGHLAIPWIPEQLLASLISLRSLAFVGCPFADNQEQQNFVAVMNESLPNLREFTYFHSHTSFPGTRLEMFGLEEITIHLHTEYDLEPTMISLIGSSSESLTALSFKFSAIESVGWQGKKLTHWKALLAMHLPTLRQLTMEPLLEYRELELFQMTTDLHNFLLRHPGLEVLLLGHGAGNLSLGRKFMPDSGGVAPTSFLPSIRLLDCIASQFATVTLRNIQIFSGLTSLTLRDDAWIRPLIMFWEMRGGSLPHLEVLRLIDVPCNDPFTAFGAYSWAQALLKASPVVKHFETNIQLGIYPEIITLPEPSLEELISSNKELRILDVDYRLTLDPPICLSEDGNVNMMVIAKQCRKLQSIIIRNVPTGFFPDSPLMGGENFNLSFDLEENSGTYNTRGLCASVHIPASYD